MTTAAGNGPSGARGWLLRHAGTLLTAAVVLLGGFVFPALIMSGNDVAKYVIGVVIPVAGVLGIIWFSARVMRTDAAADAAYAADPGAAPLPRTRQQRRGGWILLSGFAVLFLSTIPVVLFLAGP